MIVLDTNILSELLRYNIDKNVEGWFETVPDDALFTTSITQAEILYGAPLLDSGRRRAAFLDATEGMFADFSGRILPFDDVTAPLYATVMVERRASGWPIAHMDCQIASICLSRGARLATRNVRDFTDCGLQLINPFDFSFG